MQNHYNRNENSIVFFLKDKIELLRSLYEFKESGKNVDYYLVLQK